MKILIVDDTSMMRYVIREILVRAAEVNPDDIFEAAGGKEAIQRYKSHQPDVVLLDIAMPDISGIEALKEIIQIDPLAKVIMITASKDGDDVRECIMAGAVDYVIKPPQPDRLLEALKKVYTKVAEANEEMIDKISEEMGGQDGE